MKVTSPDSPGFNGLAAAAIAEFQTTLFGSSGFETTPNEWKDLPLFAVVIVTSSPEFTLISGLFPSSPGRALNAKVLKSSDSTKLSSKSWLTPVGAAASPLGATYAAPTMILPIIPCSL